VKNYDLVEIHCVFHFPAVYTAIACTRWRVPYIVRPHGSLDPYDLQKHAAAKRLYGSFILRPLLDHAAGLLLTSEREARDAVTFGSSVARYSAYLPIFQSSTSGQGKRLRTRLGLKLGHVVVLFLGRLDRKKGLERLLDAVAAVKAPLVLVLAGSGDPAYTESLRQKIVALQLEDQCFMVGQVSGEDKEDCWAAADIFALHSDNENFGIAVLEAAQHGLPLLLSPDVYIHEPFVTAGAAAAPDASDLSRTLEHLAANVEVRERMGQSAREVADKQFGVEHSMKSHLQMRSDIFERSFPGVASGDSNSSQRG